MSERISAVIYYDSKVRHTDNDVIFLSENIARLVFNQNIDLTEFRKRIRHKIFETTPMKVLSIKYQFCALVDLVTYDSFDIKGAHRLEEMVQIHLASGSPYLELYVQFSSPNDAFTTSTSIAVRGEYTTSARHSVNNESDMDPPREPGPDGAEVVLFSELERIPTEPKDVEGGSDEEEEDL
ncbi:hypothetical protein J1N35_010612 [Gossypium stocksii]|uniref:Uncharacterized protein n=1 Tax=Gossypium stocksii TaxID=47602 RepID=A0A9D4AC77_9ROSI|nr:hypothetical protein J1N35_010612 [Gossypium stocksii]